MVIFVTGRSSNRSDEIIFSNWSSGRRKPKGCMSVTKIILLSLGQFV